MTVLAGLRPLWWAAVTAGMMSLPSALTPVVAAEAPVPMLSKGEKVDWWFVYKFNSNKAGRERPFVGCGPASEERSCLFDPKTRTRSVRPLPGGNFSQQYVVASSRDGELKKGEQCLGMTLQDPVGATFDQIYHGRLFFVIWNDQFYGEPKIKGCSSGHCGGSWGHSKGVLAWNEGGEGLVMQVTTPSWPGSGSERNPRKMGNTLGCVKKPNNLNNAQHFFSVKLDKDGVMAVLKALGNASVVTDISNPQVARLGGPADIEAAAEKLGSRSDSETILVTKLTNRVTVISKPSKLHVPPWQMVSALLDGVSERTATWWASPRIYSTSRTTAVRCWSGELKVRNLRRGAVAIAKTGTWDGKTIGLIGGQNHAKIGVVTTGDKPLAIFGDLNQQGTLNPPKCQRSQNGRGGLFFVVENRDLFDAMTDLLDGDSEPIRAR
jgi:hypothetical protein